MKSMRFTIHILLLLSTVLSIACTSSNTENESNSPESNPTSTEASSNLSQSPQTVQSVISLADNAITQPVTTQTAGIANAAANSNTLAETSELTAEDQTPPQGELLAEADKETQNQEETQETQETDAEEETQETQEADAEEEAQDEADADAEEEAQDEADTDAEEEAQDEADADAEEEAQDEEDTDAEEEAQDEADADAEEEAQDEEDTDAEEEARDEEDTDTDADEEAQDEEDADADEEAQDEEDTDADEEAQDEEAQDEEAQDEEAQDEEDADADEEAQVKDEEEADEDAENEEDSEDSAVALISERSANQVTKIAFVGDQGVGENAISVLELIKSEGMDLLLIQGDLGYDDGAAILWERNIRDIFGTDFPVLSVIGNHERREYSLYKDFIERRIDRAEAQGLSCQGEPGVKANCNFNNIQVVQVAVGITEIPEVDAEDNYEDFIRESFEDTPYTWRICSWHKNQTQMQIYTKKDETGWGVYDACLDAGALITMGHSHTYSRTYLLNDFENQSIEHFGDDMALEPGKSFAFVNGLGGRDIKPQSRSPEDWFAAVYTASQNATHGALFCELAENEGECYFKDISGAVPDQFRISSSPLSGR